MRAFLCPSESQPHYNHIDKNVSIHQLAVMQFGQLHYTIRSPLALRQTKMLQLFSHPLREFISSSWCGTMKFRQFTTIWWTQITTICDECKNQNHIMLCNLVPVKLSLVRINMHLVYTVIFRSSLQWSYTGPMAVFERTPI